MAVNDGRGVVLVPVHIYDTLHDTSIVNHLEYLLENVAVHGGIWRRHKQHCDLLFISTKEQHARMSLPNTNIVDVIFLILVFKHINTQCPAEI